MDVVYSTPKLGLALRLGDVIGYAGQMYKVLEVKALNGFSKLHHLEVLLGGFKHTD